jgi:hypothetical protein
MTRRNKVLAMEGKNILEFRNKFHNFMGSTKFYMNFYSIKLDFRKIKIKEFLKQDEFI